MLFVLVVLATLGVAGYHWNRGASLESSFKMVIEDYQVAVACPTEIEAVLDFVRRQTSPEGHSLASAGGSGDWAREACKGGFDPPSLESGTAQAAATSASTPSPIAAGTLLPTTSASASFSATSTAPAEDTNATPTSVPVVLQIGSPTPETTPTTSPTTTPGPSLTPTPTPTATLDPSLTPTPTPSPNLVHIEEKQFMLDLINDARVLAGLEAVALGDNVAAQLHAEASLKSCSSSHWGPDGLKPYMRYSLAGGYQSNGENGHGLDYCIRASDGYRALGSIKYHVRQAMEGWMGSPGHRRNILDRWHKKVNIGLAWDRYNFLAYQHFEGDYVEYDRLPAIENGTLSVSGKIKNGLAFGEEGDLGVQIYFDPPPYALTRGQLARTYCYDSGLQIAALRPPLTGNFYYPVHEFVAISEPCPNPYDVPPDAPAPRTHDEAHAFWQEAYSASQSTQGQEITVPWITATKWFASGEMFSISADIASLLEGHGEGVYSIIVWGKAGDEDAIVSQYSMYYGADAPDTYSWEDTPD